MTAPEALTFDSLCNDIESYVERHDAEFVAQIPRIIMLAENRLALATFLMHYFLMEIV